MNVLMVWAYYVLGMGFRVLGFEGFRVLGVLRL